MDKCKACQQVEHDTCSLTPGCPCCEDTLDNLANTLSVTAASCKKRANRIKRKGHKMLAGK